MPLDSQIKEVLNETQQRKLNQLMGWLTSPVWVELIKPAVVTEINNLTKQILRSNDPAADAANKAQIKAFAWFLDFERQFADLLRHQERLAAEQDPRNNREPEPIGTIYVPPSHATE